MKKLSTTIIAALCAVIVTQAQVPPTLRANLIGYLPSDLKTAVYIGDDNPAAIDFTVVDAKGRRHIPDSVVVTEAWAHARHSARIYFSSLTAPGKIRVEAHRGKKSIAGVDSYIGSNAYSRHSFNELPLVYLRQQRCGYNPVHDARCHTLDGFAVLMPDSADNGSHYDVTGGWHDASDYLQYLTTSANTVYQLLFAYRMNPGIWADAYDASGRPGSNGLADILDEARWGLEWMLKMNPSDALYFNQIADDRDHRYVGVPQNDTTDYGYGPGKGRPVYPCYGKPYGLRKYLNRSRGEASSVAKFASSFGLGAELFADIDSSFAAELDSRSARAYDYARRHPGACQTACCVSPYFYEEDNWVDDTELAAAVRMRRSADSAERRKLLFQARDYGRMEPVTPWMGADSARHYQWYPFINLGHYELAAQSDSRIAEEFRRNMRSGLDRVAERAGDNAFRYGVPFIWCSNNLAAAYVTQAMLYRELTGDYRFLEYETAVRDWLFGCNPWGQVMIINEIEGIPSPADPHSAMTDMKVGGRDGRHWLVGGLVDGPVYSSIYNSLWGVHLRRPDAFAPYQGGTAVYHDDFSDYSTNEPTMDGTASLTYMLGRLCSPSAR